MQRDKYIGREDRVIDTCTKHVCIKKYMRCR